MKTSATAKLKQVPVRYLMVGVYPRKKKHAAVAITRPASDLLLQIGRNKLQVMVPGASLE
jgi:hypothetical protein